MTSTKPYLIRAIHEWCVDQGFTPYLAVHVDQNTRVPREFVRDNCIVLNVSPDASHQLMMGNDEISFQTRFNGASFPVLVPVAAVMSIYARENGQGMEFEILLNSEVTRADEFIENDAVDEQPHPQSSIEPLAEASRRGGHLTRIK